MLQGDQRWPVDRDWVRIDIFRFDEGGKIVTGTSPQPHVPNGDVQVQWGMAKPTRRSIHLKAPKKRVLVAARLTPAQVAAVEREARRRMAKRGRGRMDVSEVIREAVSVWMAIRPAQRGVIQHVAAQNDLTQPEVLRKALDTWLTSLNRDES